MSYSKFINTWKGNESENKIFDLVAFKIRQSRISIFEFLSNICLIPFVLNLRYLCNILLTHQMRIIWDAAYLRPPLFMSNFAFIFQMNVHGISSWHFVLNLTTITGSVRIWCIHIKLHGALRKLMSDEKLNIQNVFLSKHRIPKTKCVWVAILICLWCRFIKFELMLKMMYKYIY